MTWTIKETYMDRFFRYHPRLVQLQLYGVICPLMCVYAYLSFRYVPLIALFAFGAVSLLVLLLIPLFLWWGLFGLVRLFRYFSGEQVRIGFKTWLGIGGSLAVMALMLLWKKTPGGKLMWLAAGGAYLLVATHWTWLYRKHYRQTILASRGFNWVVIMMLLVGCGYALNVPLEINFGRL